MLSTSLKVLIITPLAPYPFIGACQQDRREGVRQMKQLGWDVHVIARFVPYQSEQEITEGYTNDGAIVESVYPHHMQSWKLLFTLWYKWMCNWALIDGSAIEFADPAFQKEVASIITRVQPDVIWLEYTKTWPMIALAHAHNVPVVMKSSISESLECISGFYHSFSGRLRAFFKRKGEKIATNTAEYFLAITPKEQQWYKDQFGDHDSAVLPLRGLAECFTERVHTQKDTLDLVFMGSSYNIPHNKDALEFVIRDLMPLLRQALPAVCTMHITGGKFPKDLQQYLQAEDIVYHGLVDDIGEFLQTKDIAVIPSVSGEGMQQKVFEPFCRGLPVVTHHTAGYDFVHNQDVLFGTTPESFCEHMITLTDATIRQSIADSAQAKATELFSAQRCEEIMTTAVQRAVQL